MPLTITNDCWSQYLQKHVVNNPLFGIKTTFRSVSNNGLISFSADWCNHQQMLLTMIAICDCQKFWSEHPHCLLKNAVDAMSFIKLLHICINVTKTTECYRKADVSGWWFNYCSLRFAPRFRKQAFPCIFHAKGSGCLRTWQRFNLFPCVAT